MHILMILLGIVAFYVAIALDAHAVATGAVMLVIVAWLTQPVKPSSTDQ